MALRATCLRDDSCSGRIVPVVSRGVIVDLVVDSHSRHHGGHSRRLFGFRLVKCLAFFFRLIFGRFPSLHFLLFFSLQSVMAHSVLRMCFFGFAVKVLGSDGLAFRDRLDTVVFRIGTVLLKLDRCSGRCRRRCKRGSCSCISFSDGSSVRDIQETPQGTPGRHHRHHTRCEA
ncbi:hypothetical protein BC829DRAFT_393438 [Chytridium lagenaria]|nr:hypothetical protein BC829DRAFT_393438 [Chytridium lagenaria]